MKTKGDSTVIRVGGHFAGSCALHWPHGSAGKGSLFTGDTIQVVPDNRSFSTVHATSRSKTANALILHIMYSHDAEYISYAHGKMVQIRNC